MDGIHCKRSIRQINREVLNAHLSDITLCDLAPFVPAFSPFKENLQVALEANGTINQLNCPHLSITGNQFLLKLRTKNAMPSGSAYKLERLPNTNASSGCDRSCKETSPLK